VRGLLLLAFALNAFVGACVSSAAQSSVSPPPPATLKEGIFLVFPFENAGTNSRLDWIGEGLEELTIQRLSVAGQQVYSHAGRVNEMDLSGLPPFAKLTRATMLHIAQELDADYVIFGQYVSDGQTLTVEARVLRVNPVALLPDIREAAPLASLMDLHTKLVWEVLRATDPSLSWSLADFSKLQRPVSLAAFEQYIRGLLGNDDDSRLRALKEAARLEPNWPDPAFAIGDLYFQRNDCISALPWFAKVPAGHSQSNEALFATGVCRLRQGQPEQAEEVFASLQENLRRSLISGADVPEILNNLGIARARQENLPAAFTVISRATDIDPDEDAYPFNLGLLALQQREYARAATHFAEAVKREPENPEDRAFLIYALGKEGKKTEAADARDAATEILGDGELPALQIDPKKPESLTRFQRIMPQLDTTSLRLELEGPETQQLSAGAAVTKDGAVSHLRRGRQELRAGRLDVAENEFQAALAADPQSASGHRELAQIYRRRGQLDDAARELQLSLVARDSATVHAMLAHIYLEQKKTDLARAEAEKAVKLAPNYTDAKELLKRLGTGKPTGGAK